MCMVSAVVAAAKRGEYGPNEKKQDHLPWRRIWRKLHEIS